MRHEYKFTSETCGWTPCFPTSALIGESDLPSGQRVCCFAPHCDDVRFIGATLKALQEHNDLKIIVMASGHHAITRDIPVEEKRTIRKNEMRDWADVMGLGAGCLHFLDAEATYDAKTPSPEDQVKVNGLFMNLKPTLIFISQSIDVLQPINRCTNRMIFSAIKHGVESGRDGGGLCPLIVFEYPTLYAPFIPFKKRNLNVIFTNDGLSESKHKANKAFRSMDRTFLDISERCIEAYDATCLSEFVFHYNRECYKSRVVPPINPRMLRCELFSASKIILEQAMETLIVRQEVIRFPVTGNDAGLWAKTGPSR